MITGYFTRYAFFLSCRQIQILEEYLPLPMLYKMYNTFQLHNVIAEKVFIDILNCQSKLKPLTQAYCMTMVYVNVLSLVHAH